jgi:hypothetical protein
MEMKHREPQSGRSEKSAGAPDGEALWESELPWALPPSKDVAEELTEEAVEKDTKGPATGTAAVSAVPAKDPHPAQPGPAADKNPRGQAGEPGNVTHEPASSKGHLAKPILAGAGLLSAVFLLAPLVYNLDAPAQTVQAGPEEREADHAPDAGFPDTTNASPRPRGSAAPNGDGIGKTVGHDWISAVAATVHTPGTGLATPAPGQKTPASGTTPKPADPTTPKPNPTTPKPANTTHQHSSGTSGAPGVGIYSHDSGRCIDIVGGKAVRGAALEIWDCAGKSSMDVRERRNHADPGHVRAARRRFDR